MPPRSGLDAQGIPRRRIVRAIEGVPRRVADRNRARLQAAGPAAVAIFRRRSPVKTGSLKKSWRFRTQATSGGWKISFYANHYWYYLNARGRHKGVFRRALDEIRRAVLPDTSFRNLPPK
jgi:hypothetical protein